MLERSFGLNNVFYVQWVRSPGTLPWCAASTLFVCSCFTLASLSPLIHGKPCSTSTSYGKKYCTLTLTSTFSFVIFSPYAIQSQLVKVEGIMWQAWSDNYLINVIIILIPLFLIQCVCIFLQQWEGQPRGKYVHALRQWACYWESRGEWSTFTPRPSWENAQPVF